MEKLWFYEHQVKDNFSLEGCAIGGKQMKGENTGEGVDCCVLIKKLNRDKSLQNLDDFVYC